MSDAGTRRTLAAVVLLIGLFGLCQGLTYPLLALILERQGTDPALIGLSGAMTPLGIMAAAVVLPALAGRIGSVRVALFSTLTMAALIGSIGLVRNVGAWFPLRFLLGCGISGLYVTSETWINALAPPQSRGRVLAVFATSLSLGFACGPFVLLLTGTQGAMPFVATVGLELAGAVVILAVYRRLPDIGAAARVSVRTFLPQAPFLLLVVAIVSAYDGAFLTLFPVYGVADGLSENDIAAALTVWAAGNILFQVPIGTLADRWSRRGTLLLLCGITVTGAALMPLLHGSWLTLWPLLFVWGPASYGVYNLALIELGSTFEGGALVAGNAAFAIMWGLGGLVGPPLVGLVLHGTGPRGLPLALGVIYAGLLLLGVFRRWPAAAVTAR